MKRLLVMAVLAGLVTGCAGKRVMYAGPIKLKSDARSGLMLEGPNKRPIECHAEPEDSFSDPKDGQWVVVEGASSHDGKLVIGLHDCRVFAEAVEEGASGPGLELRRRRPRPSPTARGDSAAAASPSK